MKWAKKRFKSISIYEITCTKPKIQKFKNFLLESVSLPSSLRVSKAFCLNQLAGYGGAK